MRIIYQYFAILLFSIIVLLVILEESQIGTGYHYLANQYDHEVIRNITIRRENPQSVGITVVLEAESDEKKYEMALDTLRCYSAHFGYDLYVIHARDEKSMAEKCAQKDFMFRRHCVLSLKMLEIPNTWLLFLDGDMGIINPNHLIEKYIPTDQQTQIVFYNRIMNQEVMAGSYLVKNSQWSRDFLMFWARFESRLPDSFHGSDNGAIHSIILQRGLPKLAAEREFCERTFWHRAKNYEDLTTYEVCAQHLIKSNKIAEIRILSKGRLAWARDGWLTNSVWSETDFIFHGWQKRRQDKMTFAMWHSPLIYEHPFNLTLCSTKRANENWKYKNTFMGGVIDVDRQLLSTIQEQQDIYHRHSKIIAEHRKLHE